MRALPSRSWAAPCRGFSLVETLVGLVLLAGLATAMIRLTVDATRSVERSVRISQGLAWASTMLDLLQVVPPGHPWVVEGGALDRPLADGTGTWFLDADDLRILWRVEPLPGDSSLLRIEVVVRHRRAGPGSPPLARLAGIKERET